MTGFDRKSWKELVPKFIRISSAKGFELVCREKHLERQPGKQEPKADLSATWIESGLRIKGTGWVGFQNGEGMLEGQIAVLHPRLAAEIAVRPTRHQVKNSFIV